MLPPYNPIDDEDSPFLTECYVQFSLSMAPTRMSSTNAQRRPSFDSLESSVPPELLSASSVGTISPSTPLNSCLFSSDHADPFRAGTLQVDLQSAWNSQHEDFGEHNLGYSPAAPKEHDLPRYINPYSMSNHNPKSFYSSSCNSFSDDVISPALSRPMFNQTVQSSMSLASSTDWSSAVTVHTPLRTIDPSTFAPPFPSTPSVKLEGLRTPSRLHTRSSMILSSSPMSSYSSGIVPSQHEIDDSTYFGSGDVSQDPVELTYDGLGMNLDMRDHGRDLTYRLSRRRYDRKGLGSGCKRRPLTNKSGFECDRVITANSFACSYPECIDKSTGKQKRFKRAEHKKRHEKTVHQKDTHASHRCWVPQCEKSFSRTDNLKSHLQKTHGKRSPGARNRYVATLDPNNSQYFSPDWQGNLTSEGLPIRTRG